MPPLPQPAKRKLQAAIATQRIARPRPREASIIGIHRVAVVAHRQAPQVQAVDRHANGPRAAVAEDELTNARMNAAEFAGEDAIDHSAAGKKIGRPTAQWIFDSRDPPRKTSPRAAIQRPIAHLRPAEHLGWNMLLA